MNVAELYSVTLWVVLVLVVTLVVGGLVLVWLLDLLELEKGRGEEDVMHSAWEDTR